MKRNIELKAKCADLLAAREASMKIGAQPQGVLVQTDTYFHVATGRLKLREIENGRAELIWYARANETAFRASDYIVSPVLDVPSMLTALTKALGVRGVVKKTRDLLLYHNVRIHLDEVQYLGTFIEFEAVISDFDDEAVSRDRLIILTKALAISDDDRIAVSYSDLMGI